jgi:hypothetical protein
MTGAERRVERKEARRQDGQHQGEGERCSPAPQQEGENRSARSEHAGISERRLAIGGKVENDAGARRHRKPKEQPSMGDLDLDRRAEPLAKIKPSLAQGKAGEYTVRARRDPDRRAVFNATHARDKAPRMPYVPPQC